MWFIGLLLGMLFGSLGGFGDGTLWGAMLGALAGAIFGYFRRTQAAGEFEKRIAARDAPGSEFRQRAVAPAAKVEAPGSVPAAASIVLPDVAPQSLQPLAPLPVPDPVALGNAVESIAEPVAHPSDATSVWQPEA